MKIYHKFISGYNSRKCNLTLIFPNKFKKLFFVVRKISINRKSTQKHPGLLLDKKLNFSEHISEKH